MQSRYYISILLCWIIILILNSCSNSRFLVDDQMLYSGRKVKMVTEEKTRSTKKAQGIAEEVSFAEPNNSIMGKRILPPVGLWIYNYQKPEEGKRGGFFYRKLSSEPVLISNINPEIRSLKIEKELFNNGFFHANTSYVLDTSRVSPRKASIVYKVAVDKPFKISKIINPPPLDSIDTLINKFTPELDVKSGDIFNLEDLKDQKSKLANLIVNQGYYFFSPEQIEMVADTTETPYMINLLIRKATDIQPFICKKYSINQIEVYVKPNIDKGKALQQDTVSNDGISITGETDYLKPEVITSAILFRKGDLYSATKRTGTIPLLNNYGVFESVRLLFSVDDSIKQTMNLHIELRPKKDVSLNLEGAVQAKSSGFAGPTSEVSIAHSNLFKGANRLQLKAYGGFEWQWGKKSSDELGSNSYNMGINSSMIFPRMIVPFKSIKENKSIIGKTIGTLGFDFINNIEYYRMNSINMGFGYSWHKNPKMSHQFLPVKINIVSLLKTTSAFDSIVNNNPYVKLSFEEQHILGTEYSFTYDNSALSKNGFYFQGIINTSGNLISLVNQLSNKQRPFTIMGNVYSQFVKTSVDVRYYTKTTKEGLVLRFYAGTGLTYGNSTVMPYVEQYYSGGSNSLRGFTARSLGPGSYKPQEYNGIIDQTGDIKLEFNSEYRFKMTKILLGALFLETGNVWLMNEDPGRPGSGFKFNTFANQLAVDAGIGLRFDFNFFVLRTDVGFPLRYPYDSGKGNWNNFKDALSGFLFNIAIGYPF